MLTLLCYAACFVDVDVVTNVDVKGLVHLKMTFLSSLIHPHAVPKNRCETER